MIKTCSLDSCLSKHEIRDIYGTEIINYINNIHVTNDDNFYSGNIKKYHIKHDKNYLLYVEDVKKFNDLPDLIKGYLKENRQVLRNRATVKNEGRTWWRYSRPMHKELYPLPKIFCNYRNKTNEFALDKHNEFIGLTNTTVIFDTYDDLDISYLLCLLNSN